MHAQIHMARMCVLLTCCLHYTNVFNVYLEHTNELRKEKVSFCIANNGNTHAQILKYVKCVNKAFRIFFNFCCSLCDSLEFRCISIGHFLNIFSVFLVLVSPLVHIQSHSVQSNRRPSVLLT